MKVVINKCWGGFSLSNKAVKRMAELQGKECYFFEHDLKKNKYTPIKEKSSSMWSTAFSIPNPNDFFSQKEWSKMTSEERKEQSEKYKSFHLTNRPEDRSDPILIQVVEELGKKANGECAELKIVEIPDGIQWEIDEYDGRETIAEVHNTWG